jgi:hypothetical protein
MGDLAAQDMDLRRAMARASLRRDWEIAKAYPITDEEIEKEIQAARAERAAGAERAAKGEKRAERKKKIA